MLKEFENLSPAETAVMLDAIPNIIVLVAAADDNLDATELAAAQKLADVRAYDNRSHLNAYYETIDAGLSERVKELCTNLPVALREREAILTARLGEVDQILNKLESPYDYYYSETFHSFAKHVAEAHGGFLRYFTVGPKEAKVVDLPMIERRPQPEDNQDLI